MVKLSTLFALVLASLGSCGERSDPPFLADGDQSPVLDRGTAPRLTLDSGLRAPDLPLTCADEETFLANHRACSTDGDCAIAGECSGGFGFRAVQRSALPVAQRLSERGMCSKVFDGPRFSAVCEQNTCHARPTGSICGAPPPRDGGTYGCPPDQQQYRMSCEEPLTQGHDTQGCYTRCTGPGDANCGPARTCVQVLVVGLNGQSCSELIPVFLCRPAP